MDQVAVRKPAIRVGGSPFKTFAEAETACEAMLAHLRLWRSRRKLKRDQRQFLFTSTRSSRSKTVTLFANVDAAEKWFEENDPEGVAFEYEVLK